jgi:prephenate dehydratase
LTSKKGRLVARKVRVGFQGERGAFSEKAAVKLVGEQIDLAPQKTFLDMFRALNARRIEFAIVPIENTLAGSVIENYDLLLKFRFPILAETSVRIVHNLIVNKSVSLRAVKKVYSHPVALRQCLKFLDKHRNWEVVTYYDTAGSVKMITEEKVTDSAAIASEISASIYGAKIIAWDIGDDKENYTRFFLLGRKSPHGKTLAHLPKQAVKTSIAFVTKNQPGALARCLSIFAMRDISLTKIESRPIKGRPFEYRFYVDFLGAQSDPAARSALKQLAENTEFVRVFGSYPSV